jgi:multiple sugar transport system permease protein
VLSKVIKTVKKSYTGWLFVLPSLVMFLVFLIIPAIIGFFVSLTDYSGLSGNYIFKGLENYSKMFGDRYFKTSIKNNIIYALIFTPATMLISLFTATLLNQINRFTKLFRTVLFLPYVTSMVAVAVIWKVIFNPLGGPLNTILENIGIQNPPQWLAASSSALYAVIIVSVWKNCGYYMLIFLAGMQNIPDSLYESAELDGAKSLQKYLRITLPMLSPTIFLNLILVIISSFQVFDLISVMTEGGPGMSTNVLVFRIYYEAFKAGRMGYASAIAYFLFAIVLVITLIQFALQKYWVYYE